MAGSTVNEIKSTRLRLISAIRRSGRTSSVHEATCENSRTDPTAVREMLHNARLRVSAFSLCLQSEDIGSSIRSAPASRKISLFTK